MSDPAQRDCKALATLLEDVERRSRDLPWAKKQPWRRSSHVWVEQGVATVDLHDLSVRLAGRVVEAVEGHAWEAGAVCLVTGRGNHTGGRSRLRDTVLTQARQRARAAGWQVRDVPPGRVMLVTDPSKVASRPMGCLWWLFVVLLGAGALATCLPS